MAQILVRDLDDEVIERLKLRAAQHKRSFAAEVRTILAETARTVRTPEEIAEAVEQLDALRKSLEGRHHTDSVELAREDRDSGH